jgi:hypothetical protein
MSHHEVNELFDLYHFGNMSTPERNAFEEKLRTDSSFQEEYTTYLKSVEMINLLGVRNDIEKIIKAGSPPRKLYAHRTVWLSIAASLALIVVVVLFKNRSQGDSTASLANSYYQPYPDLVATRGTATALSAALEVYSKGDYGQALQLLKKNTSSDTTIFYSGICYISLSKPDSALYMFDKLTSQSLFYSQTSWYSAIALLLKGDSETAADRLRQIKSQQFRYAESQELLRKLER